MAKIRWNQGADAEGAEPPPIVWSCSVAMRADGSLETQFDGETGFQMMKAAVDALHMIDRLRQEPAYDFGRKVAASRAASAQKRR